MKEYYACTSSSISSTGTNACGSAASTSGAASSVTTSGASCETAASSTYEVVAQEGAEHTGAG